MGAEFVPTTSLKGTLLVKQIAILGSQGYKSSRPDIVIDCYPWSRINSIKNLSDYHSVLINLLSLTDKKSVDWSAFHNALNIGVMAEILGAHGQIIVIGDPDFSILVGEKEEQPFLEWTGIVFEWDRRSGRSTENVIEEYSDRVAFEDYLENLTSWTYSLTQIRTRKEDLIDAFGIREYMESMPRLQIGAVLTPFWTNRAQAVLAGRISVVVDYHLTREDIERKLRFGQLVLLPPTSLTEAESIEQILGDALEVEVATPEPEWVGELIAPNQESIDAELNEIEEQISLLVNRHKEQLELLGLIRKPLKLLYGMHADLEEAVIEVLQSLGAEVTIDDERKEEDALLSVLVDGQMRFGVVEVKSTERTTLEEKGLRQLHDWVSRAISRDVDAPKGIFIANTSATMHPKDRTSPFGANFMKSATNRRFAVIKSEDLFFCYALQAQGRLDIEKFWRELFATEGVFDVSRYRGLLEEESVS